MPFGGEYTSFIAIITNDDNFATNARIFANHGSLQKHQHHIEGINSRMDGIQASILNVKLKYIDEWNLARNKHGLMYNELLQSISDIKKPKVLKDAFHIFHLYVIRTEKRDELAKYLKSRKVYIIK